MEICWRSKLKERFALNSLAKDILLEKDIWNYSTTEQLSRTRHQLKRDPRNNMVLSD
jgi:hypothetical protein